MSSETIPGGEGEPRGTKQVKVRVKKDVADAYDAVCDRDGKSRAQSLREHMTATVEADAGDDEDDGRAPPQEPELADAWRHLKRLSRGRHLRRSRACAYLAVRMQDMDAEEAWRLITTLRERHPAKMHRAERIRRPTPGVPRRSGRRVGVRPPVAIGYFSPLLA